jgi:hypothetical protein
MSFVEKDQMNWLVLPNEVVKFKLYAVTIPDEAPEELIITASGKSIALPLFTFSFYTLAIMGKPRTP